MLAACRWWLMVMYIVFQWDTPIQSIECALEKRSECGKLTLTKTWTCSAFKWNTWIDFYLCVGGGKEIWAHKILYIILYKSLIEMNNSSGKIIIILSGICSLKRKNLLRFIFEYLKIEMNNSVDCDWDATAVCWAFFFLVIYK